MARIDKNITSARRLALIVLTVMFASISLVTRDIREWTQLDEARELAAYWVLCDVTQDIIEVGEVRRKKNIIPSTDLDFAPGFYANLGFAAVRRTSQGYYVEISDIPIENFPVPQIPDLKPWRKDISPPAILLPRPANIKRT
ncbi:MAG TPA: hypothetical protein VN493_27530 [Thermoanaerobaculia bacterium]|nr:hypothetical protein [Thermoanaerobaculia bacterium]